MGVPSGDLVTGTTTSGSPGTCFRESFHCAFAATKHEDVSIVRGSKAFSSGVSLYAVADGHNGCAAARFVSTILPAELEQQLGAARDDKAVRQALARAFLAVDEKVTQQLVQSGCTLTAAVVCGDVLTVASVGDSRAVLDTGAEVVELAADHRIGENPAECARLERAGGRLARLNEYGAGPSQGPSDGVGPVRLWPGGIMVGRAVGDRDVGPILLANPHIRQVRLPVTGARLIVASDGLWDSLPAGRVARVLRQHASAKAAATQAVSSVAAARGGFFADDVTVIVADILPRHVADFREVCAQFGGRLRNALSSPNITALLEDSAAAPPPRAAPPRRRSGGLFACFGRPAAVVDEDAAQVPPLPLEYSGRGVQLNPSRSLRGGSERSVRGGVVRDPSVRGAGRATSLELLCDVDTASWGPSDFGRPASLGGSSREAVSRSSSAGRMSPRGIVEGLAFGPSLSSINSEEDGGLGGGELQRTLSKSSHNTSPRSRADSGVLGVPVEKKCHGSNAAAALLR